MKNEPVIHFTKSGKRRGLKMAVPRLSKRAIREIMGRLKERNPNLFIRDLTPEQIVLVVGTAWIYGWGQSLKAVK